MGKHPCLLAAVAVLACGCLATRAAAEVRIEGNLSALRVTASGDALADVLSAFGNQFRLKYRTAVPLNVEINGVYSGSLSQVVARLLNGYNYVIKRDQELTEIIILGKNGEAAVSPRAPPVKGNGL